MFRKTLRARGWHYIHPRTGRPLPQTRLFNDPRYINNEAAMITGQWGLITADFGIITQTQLENARLAILRRLPKAKFQLLMHTDMEETPVVKKPVEARMGGGKASIHHFAFKLTTGIPLFEIVAQYDGSVPLSKSEAEVIFLAGRVHIPLETVVVPQGRVNEYSVFK